MFGDVSVFWAALRLLLVGMQSFFCVQLLMDRVKTVLLFSLYIVLFVRVLAVGGE